MNYGGVIRWMLARDRALLDAANIAAIGMTSAELPHVLESKASEQRFAAFRPVGDVKITVAQFRGLPRRES